MRHVISCGLIAWVGVICPGLCGVPADSVERPETSGGCCARHCNPPATPDVPRSPQEEAPADCFCSGHVVQAPRGQETEDWRSFPPSMLEAVAGPPAPSPCGVSGLFELPIVSHPPDLGRTLPLLI